ncbi:flagellin [Sporomusa sp.]|uniref:flagellin N-terminal helical domain-containing protein n=1 Tax=Sporomusa sp. TaxID=2078658 RepID=UPI002C5D49CF|nr:flagellin [Sporomusa sp.]HWR45780.1 flagellin [Sporomusa sp.]
MIINHNMSAINTLRQMETNQKATSGSLEKLSSGLRINKAGDDAAGLAISEKMRGQIRGLDQASRNAQDSISMIQTAEGGLNETQSILQRMRELAVQASTDTNTTTDRSALQDEMKQLTNEIDRIANTTEFNTKKLLNGDLKGPNNQINGSGALESTFGNGSVKLSNIQNVSKNTLTDVIYINIVSSSKVSASGISAAKISTSTVLGNITKISIAGGQVRISTNNITGGQTTLTIKLTQDKSIRAGDTITISIQKGALANNGNNAAVAQIGANAGQVLKIGVNAMDSTSIGVRDTKGNALDLTTQKNADGAIYLVNNAIEKVSTERSKLGALQNRLEHTINNLGTSSENVTAAESRIRDVDLAKEMTTFQKSNILNQAAQAMLAQANQQPQGVLQLLR